MGTADQRGGENFRFQISNFRWEELKKGGLKTCLRFSVLLSYHSGAGSERRLEWAPWPVGQGRSVHTARRENLLAYVISKRYRGIRAADVIRGSSPKITSMTTSTPPLIEAPASTASYAYETLGYVDAYDAVLNCDYAFVAYKETDKSSGAWRVYIKSSQTAGGSFEPAAIRLKARETGAQGKPYFTWGYRFETSAGDPRQIEFRVHVANGQAKDVEIVVGMRNADHTAAKPVSVKFPWPAA